MCSVRANEQMPQLITATRNPNKYGTNLPLRIWRSQLSLSISQHVFMLFVDQMREWEIWWKFCGQVISFSWPCAQCIPSICYRSEYPADNHFIICSFWPVRRQMRAHIPFRRRHNSNWLCHITANVIKLCAPLGPPHVRCKMCVVC